MASYTQALFFHTFSGAPDTWLTNELHALTGVACTQLFDSP
jgi:hypothetical protein